VKRSSWDLRHERSYEALSWAWGDLRYKKELRIGNSTLHIPANLEPALQQLRHEKRSLDLWIDALCINQSDIQERSEQV
jgi:hypothetical protein